MVTMNTGAQMLFKWLSRGSAPYSSDYQKVDANCFMFSLNNITIIIILIILLLIVLINDNPC